MGFLDNLFKSQPKTNEKSEIVETVKPAERRGGEGSAAHSAPGAVSSTHGAPGSGSNVAPPGPPSSASQRPPGQSMLLGVGAVLVERAAATGSPSKSRSEIALTLGDILSRIPTQFLRPGMHDAQRELHFRVNDFSGVDTARPTVSLARLAAQCPTVFATTVPGFDSAQVPVPAEPIRKHLEQQRANASERAAAPVPSTTPSSEAPVTDEKLELSLAAVLKRCPRDIVIGSLPVSDENARITLPLAQIAQQLPSGKVEISALQFIAALPPTYRDHFHAVEGVNVSLPLQEILDKLPRQPSSAAPHAPAPETPITGGDNLEKGAAPGVPAAGTPAAAKRAASETGGNESRAPAQMSAPPARPVLVPLPVTAASTPAVLGEADQVVLLARSLAGLPGLQACIIAARGELAQAGELPAGLDPAIIRTLATQLAATLRGSAAPEIDGVHHLTVYGDAFSLAFFLQADVVVVAVVRTRSFVPGVRERLLAAAAKLTHRPK